MVTHMTNEEYEQALKDEYSPMPEGLLRLAEDLQKKCLSNARNKVLSLETLTIEQFIMSEEIGIFGDAAEKISGCRVCYIEPYPDKQIGKWRVRCEGWERCVWHDEILKAFG